MAGEPSARADVAHLVEKWRQGRDHDRQDYQLPGGEEQAQGADARKIAGLQQVVMVAPLSMASEHREQYHGP
jgi:hypothetical protein